MSCNSGRAETEDERAWCVEDDRGNRRGPVLSLAHRGALSLWLALTRSRNVIASTARVACMPTVAIAGFDGLGLRPCLVLQKF